MKDWRLSRDGFIMNYMLAGPAISDYTSDTRIPDQLALEAALRKEIVTPKEQEKNPEIHLGELAENGCRWTINYSYGSNFVDMSDFYSTLQRIDMDVATVLWSPKEQKVSAAVWTYMSVGIYCNGVLIGEEDTPVYKPIRKQVVELPLKEGRNLLYFRCENLGVRDTRNILGVQILEGAQELRVQLADEAYQDSIYDAVYFMDHLRLWCDRVIFPVKAPIGTAVCCPVESPDYDVMSLPRVWENVEGSDSYSVPQGKNMVIVRVCAAGIEMTRTLELSDRYQPEFAPQGISREENFRLILEKIAAVSSENRGHFGFAMTNVLARKYLGKETPRDRELILETLRLIDLRVDCSDFILCGLLRYIHEYGLDAELAEKTKEVLLRYRYWMTMDGADAMCFWSENHSLMFYACAMDAGALYPDAYFVRAKMTGEELHQYGRRKVLEWLDDVEQYGFEEFLSTVYMCVTFAAVLNVVDYAEEAISLRASAVADKLLSMLSTHTFKGCVVAPMGRIYRGVLYPFSQGAQSLMNLIDPSVPYAYGEGWLGYLASSKYKVPAEYAELMRGDAEITYESGNARICLEKNEAYCLTSVQSPRESCYTRWENIMRDPEADPDTHEYNKSLNECFHGTTSFAPGVYGYQQHMWYGALDGEAVIFANHPGSTGERSGMRPGYWNGNGVMPAISQVHGMIGAVYHIPDDYPIHFTHLYCPKSRFDEVISKEHWLFFRKGNGYMALWCSAEWEAHDDMLFDCELRAYGDSIAYLCVCKKAEEYASFEAFMEDVWKLAPRFDEADMTLKAGNPASESCYELKYEKCSDETQYVD